MPGKSTVTNQTLDRGLWALELIAEAHRPPTVEELAGSLGIHRSMAYRIVRTLESRGLTRRDDRGRCHPWVRLTDLARGVGSSLQSVARPELLDLATEFCLTAFLVVADGLEAVTIDSAEPPRSDTVVGYRPGTRHSLESGAPGLALLAGRAPESGERREVREARRRGWAQSTGEVVEGLGSIATWIDGPDLGPVGAIALLFLDQAPPDAGAAARRLQISARRIADALGSPVSGATG